MSDKELLELAAKAAGIPIVPCTCNDKRWRAAAAIGEAMP